MGAWEGRVCLTRWRHAQRHGVCAFGAGLRAKRSVAVEQGLRCVGVPPPNLLNSQTLGTNGGAHAQQVWVGLVVATTRALVEPTHVMNAYSANHGTKRIRVLLECSIDRPMSAREVINYGISY